MLSITSLKYARCTCPTFIALRIVIRCYIVITLCVRYTPYLPKYSMRLFIILAHIYRLEKKEKKRTRKKERKKKRIESLL